MIVRPWRKGDTERVKLQPAQDYMVHFQELHTDLSELSDAGLAWTIEDAGDVLAIAGLAVQWENRALAWALVSESAGRRMRRITTEVRQFLDAAPYRRIEANVDVGFKAGHQWMRLLGFELEGYMKAYRPDGADMILYAKVK